MSLAEILSKIKETNITGEDSRITESGLNIKYNPRDNIKDLSYIDTFLKVISQNSQLIINYKNVETAYIDMNTGEITLPLYIVKDRDMYILMGSHEVSHALNTPKDFYALHNSKNAPTIHGIKINRNLFSCINIVEDIRIEKLIRNQFPGFVAIYKNGYKKLLDTNPNFKVSKSSWNKMDLANKINIKSKAGDLISFPLTDTEVAVLKYMKTAKTFDDVIIRAVYLYKSMLKDSVEKSKLKFNNSSDSADNKRKEKFIKIIDEELKDAQEATDELNENSDGPAINSKMLKELNNLIENLEESLNYADDYSTDIMEESKDKFIKKNKKKHSADYNFNGKAVTAYTKIIKDPLSAIISYK